MRQQFPRHSLGLTRNDLSFGGDHSNIDPSLAKPRKHRSTIGKSINPMISKSDWQPLKKNKRLKSRNSNGFCGAIHKEEVCIILAIDQFSKFSAAEVFNHAKASGAATTEQCETVM